MGLRFELLLFSAVLALAAFLLQLNVEGGVVKKSSPEKALMFSETTFTEVDTQGWINRARLSRGIQQKEKLTMFGLSYESQTLTLLRADRAEYDGTRFHLNGNIVFIRKDGLYCTTQQASYDRKVEILATTAPFSAYKAPNLFEGKAMRFEGKNKELVALQVKALMQIDDRNATQTHSNEG